ncbi:uncharacterized protein [Halyomorpha halys]|uniref:uncharacterized protein isoform X2 n=1 Tax=Halyomorpha halys TaxID=286706 RepID=UPI0006D519D8|nr:uncharacterized protein LOC106682806 isoform X2 [Halyomorpha halys]
MKKPIAFDTIFLKCFFLLIYSLPTSEATEGCTTACETPNVRTVLFKQTDLVKECWSDEELVLLYTRRLMQELIPKRIPCRLPLLLEFIKLTLESARDIACSVKAHRLIMLAISDAFGGYLQAYGVPITNTKYYEGTVSYCTARQVNELQNSFKKTLDTDGGGWTGPVYVKHSKHIDPFVVSSFKPTCCSNLITNSDLGKSVFCNGNDNDNDPQPEKIPLPFLDDLGSPRAIAVPFRERSLYSLFTRNASDILLRYYASALRCLGPPADQTCNDVSSSPQAGQFLTAYHSWLCKGVMPHLHDDIWYPGFGGVYRIMEAMAQKGLQRCDNNEGPEPENMAFHIDDTCECESTSPLFYLAAVLALILLFWIIVCLLCCLIKCCASSSESESSVSTSTSSSGAFINTLATLYCDNKDSDVKGCKSSSSTPLLHNKR